MRTGLNIAIFDGTFKTTAFINRLIHGLSTTQNVFVFGFNEQLSHKIPNVTYVALGSTSHTARLYWLSFGFAVKALFLKGDFSVFITYINGMFTFKKQRLQQLNLLTAISLYKPHIFHIQWPSLLPWCEKLFENPAIKVVLSQRGYQNNVRPFVDVENLTYLQKVYPKIHGFHSVSKAMTKTSNKVYANPQKIDRVVYSGFTFNQLPFSETYTRNEKLQIISIGRPHWKKGYDYALKAMNLLQRQGVLFHYNIVGGSGNEELEYLVANYNLEASVTILPKVNQQKVYELMMQSDIFLLPSLEEGLPNVLIEAMALGVPVVATNCGGVNELVDETTGILIPTRDAERMAQAIRSFAKTPLPIINEQRLQARKRVMSKHSEKQMVAGMEALYFEVLGVD
ncbi:MAG: colanic acid biosynthesis protein [Flavobacteriaceae bacterium]|nr:colanic acid biosynthesis protein [Flavobacteriaceae bacterium]